MPERNVRFERLPDGSLLDKETGQLVDLPATDAYKHNGHDSRKKKSDAIVPYRPIRPANIIPDNDPDLVKPRPDLLPPAPLRKKGRNAPRWTWADLIKEVGEEEVEMGDEIVPLKVAVVRAAFYHALEGNASMLKELFERSEGKMTQNLAIKNNELHTDEMSEDDINDLIRELVEHITVIPSPEDQREKEYGQLPPGETQAEYGEAPAEPEKPVSDESSGVGAARSEVPGSGIEFLE